MIIMALITDCAEHKVSNAFILIGEKDNYVYKLFDNMHNFNGVW